jgi:hypothetical protein
MQVEVLETREGLEVGEPGAQDQLDTGEGEATEMLEILQMHKPVISIQGEVQRVLPASVRDAGYARRHAHEQKEGCSWDERFRRD